MTQPERGSTVQALTRTADALRGAHSLSVSCAFSLHVASAVDGANDDRPSGGAAAVSCLLPRAAADALDLATIVERARAADVGDPEFAAAPTSDGTNRVRITCSIQMAYFLIEELRRVAKERMATADRHWMAASGLGLAALYAGIDDARRERRRKPV